MINFYVTRVRLGKMTLDEVPSRYRDAVAKELGL